MTRSSRSATRACAAAAAAPRWARPCSRVSWHGCRRAATCTAGRRARCCSASTTPTTAPCSRPHASPRCTRSTFSAPSSPTRTSSVRRRRGGGRASRPRARPVGLPLDRLEAQAALMHPGREAETTRHVLRPPGGGQSRALRLPRDGGAAGGRAGGGGGAVRPRGQGGGDSLPDDERRVQGAATPPCPRYTPLPSLHPVALATPP